MAAREGTLKEKPLPERIDWTMEMVKASISDWTEVRERSVTSRQLEESDRSERVRGFEEEADAVEITRDCKVWRITESGFRRFLKRSSVVESGSGWRRFLDLVEVLSAILVGRREMGFSLIVSLTY